MVSWCIGWMCRKRVKCDVMRYQQILVLLVNLEIQVRLMSPHTAWLVEWLGVIGRRLLFFDGLVAVGEVGRVNELGMVGIVVVVAAFGVGFLPVEGEQSLVELFLEHVYI